MLADIDFRRDHATDKPEPPETSGLKRQRAQYMEDADRDRHCRHGQTRVQMHKGRIQIGKTECGRDRQDVGRADRRMSGQGRQERTGQTGADRADRNGQGRQERTGQTGADRTDRSGQDRQERTGQTGAGADTTDH